MARRKNLRYVNSVEIIAGILLVLLLSQIAYSHEEEVHETATEGIFHQFSTTTVIALSIVAIAACTIMLLSYKDALGENQKRIIFGVIAVVAIVSTGYLVGNTIYLSLTSWSKGLIHWHADFEIWVCGNNVILPEPKGIANRIGTADIHHHGDYRIHLEGVMKESEDATLGNFFDAIDVPFSNDIIMNMKNGDYCPDGNKGSVKMFINDNLYSGDYRDYIISPYSDVPPGDFIRIVFV